MTFAIFPINKKKVYLWPEIARFRLDSESELLAVIVLVILIQI